MKDCRKLVVWEKANQLVLAIYRNTINFPEKEQCGLVSQIRRAAVSTSTNIAEGCGKYSQLDFAKYLQNALGSAKEVEYLSHLSFELNYLDQKIYDALHKDMNKIKAMLISLIQKVRNISNSKHQL